MNITDLCLFFNDIYFIIRKIQLYFKIKNSDNFLKCYFHKLNF